MSGMGLTLACRQSSGTQPVWSELWKMILRIGAMSPARVLSTNGCIRSGPMALWGLSFSSIFWMPSVDIMSGDMDGVVELGLRVSVVSAGSVAVNTELNWALNISALSLGSSFRIPLCLSGAMSMESVFLCLMNCQSFYLIFVDRSHPR